jgi:excisionase family DNA binding protein
MNDYLTTRQVQDLLQVDRITIYRMLGDGRLKGVKIGSQWRFTRSIVEQLLKSGACCDTVEAATESQTFPTHCIQTILDLFTSLSGLGSILVDTEGRPVAESGLCAFCKAAQQTKGGRAACEGTWREAAQWKVESLICPAGLHYQTAPVRDGEKTVAWILLGQYAQSTLERSSAGRRMTGFCGEPSNLLDEAAESIPLVTVERLGTYADYPHKVAVSLESILSERAILVDRLQRISALSSL